MPEEKVLEPEDASASPEGYVDKSIDTSVEVTPEPVEVETEAEESEAEPESEAESSPADEENVDETIDPPDPEYGEKVKARIDELTGKWRESDRLLAVKDAELAELREKLEASADEPYKTLEDFEYDNAQWQSYMAEETTRRATKAAEKVVREFQGKADKGSVEESFRTREAEFAATVPDYNDKVYGEVDGVRKWQCSEAMRDELQISEIGGQLTYYLASNPDKAADMAKLSSRSVIRSMKALEDTLKAEKVKAMPKKVTKAPPPPPKIKAGDAGMTKDPADMSDKEFATWRRKQIASR